jgi:hypothetical protein
MGRRRLLLVPGAATLFVVWGLALLLWLTTSTAAPGVSWENYRRLRIAMPARDVEVLLGKPHEVFPLQSKSGEPYGWTSLWRGEHVVIRLSFELDQGLASGQAASQEEDFGTGQVENLHYDESILDRIRQWLDW